MNEVSRYRCRDGEDAGEFTGFRNLAAIRTGSGWRRSRAGLKILANDVEALATLAPADTSEWSTL